MDRVKVDLVVGENSVRQAMEENLQAAERLDTAIQGVSGSAQRTTQEVTASLRKQEQSIVQATRTADDYRRAMQDNEQQIQRINRALARERAEVLRLEKQYKRMGDRSTKEAQELKRAIDRLNTSIEESVQDTRLLSAEQEVARHAMQELAEQGDKTAGKISLTTNEARNLGFQFQDLAVQIGSGQGLFRPLLQQLPQMVGALGGSRRAMQFFRQQTVSALKAALSLRGAAVILTGGLVALIAVPLIAFFSRSSAAAEWLSDKIAFLSGAFRELGNRLFTVGEALFNWATGAGEFADVTHALSKATDNLTASMAAAGEEAENYNQQIRKIEKAQRDFIVTEARTNAVIAERRNLAEDEGRSISNRINQIREAGRLESELEEQRIFFAQKRLEDLRHQNTVGDGQLRFTDEIAEAEAELYALRSEAAQREFSDQQQIRALQNEAMERRKEQIEAMRELQLEAEKVRQRLRDLQNADAQGVDKIRLDTIKATEEISSLETALRELYAQRKQQFDLEEEFAQLRQLTQERASRDIQNAQAKQLREEEEFAKRLLEIARARDVAKLDQQEELAQLLNEAQVRNGLTETEAEFAKELEKLDIQRRFAQERLKIIEEQFGPTSPEANILRAQIELYRQQYESLANTDLSGLQLFREKVMSALGLDQQGLQQIAGLFASFGQTLTDTIIGVTEAQISEQDRLLDAIQGRVDETGQALEEQRRLQEQGFANDADLLQEKLETEQQLLAQAEERKLALQKKSARQRLAIDAAQQASSYITTVTNLLASESSRGLIGIVTVLSGLALIANIVAKARANAAEFQPQGFKDGTPRVTGPGDSRSDSIPAYLSRDERVVDANNNMRIGFNTSTEDLVRYYEIGRGIEAPNFAGVDQKAAAVIVQGQQVSELERQAEYKLMEAAYTKAAAKTAEEMIAYWKTRPISYPTREGTVTEFFEGGARVRKVVKYK